MKLPAQKRERGPGIATVVLALLAFLAAASWCAAAPEPPAPRFEDTIGSLPLSTARSDLAWYDVLDNALGVASEEFRPVVVYFKSESCGWCARMKRQVLPDPAVGEQLEHFVRVEIDVEEQPGLARRYLVASVPALRVLSAEGRLRRGADGFLTAPQMVNLLRASLNTEFLREMDKDFRELLETLETGTLEAGRWPEVLLSLGEREKREALRDAVINLDPFPAGSLVTALSDPRLSVRLGALELLEGAAGENFGFDPWGGVVTTPANRAALERWEDWVGQNEGERVSVVYSTLTAEQIAGYLRDLTGEERDRSERAAVMLRHGGEVALEAMDNFLDLNPDLPDGAKARVHEVLFALTMPQVGEHEPDSLARRLVYGNLDGRIETLALLKEAGPEAMPILERFLDDEDPLIRETAVDAILAAGHVAALPSVRERLAGESNPDVILAALRGIGAQELRDGADIAARFLDGENEDAVILALETLGVLRASDLSGEMLTRLEDERWRVRVAALEALSKLDAQSSGPKIRTLLHDEDAFVRSAAISAVSSLNDKGAADELLALYQEDDSLKAPVINALQRMSLPLPATLQDDLRDADSDTLLAVIDVISNRRGTDPDLIAPWVEHPNDDVSAAAIRFLSNSAMGRPSYQRIVADLLKGDDGIKALAALEDIRIEESSLAPHRRSTGRSRSGDSGTPELVEEIFTAFLEPGRPLADGEGASPPSSPLADLLSSAGPWLDPDRGGDAVSWSATLLLGRVGDERALGILESSLSTRPEDERVRAARKLGAGLNEHTGPVILRLTRDPSSTVRRAAASVLLDRENTSYLTTVLDEVARPGSRLLPNELNLRTLGGLFRQGAEKNRGREWAEEVLRRSIDPSLRSLALYVLQHSWSAGSETVALSSAESDNPVERRAAWFALARNRKDILEESLDEIAADPSERVRAVLPQAYDSDPGDWTHYFSADEVVQVSDASDRFGGFGFSGAGDPFGGSSFQAPRLEQAPAAALRGLLSDPSDVVRVNASFVLLASGEEIDMREFTTLLARFPDPDSIRRRVTRYLVEHHEKLDPEYSGLLAYLDLGRISSDDLERVQKHFVSKGADGASAKERSAALAARNSSPPPAPAPGGASRSSPPAEPGRGEDLIGNSVEMVYFTTPGCDECDRVHRLLEEMREAFPRLSIAEHNIRDASAARLNESLGERFGVPDRIRLVTPALFTGGGYLIKEDISPAAIGNLVSRAAHAGTSPAGWANLGEAAEAAAGEAIQRRFSTVGLAVVLSAGALDGINPCAFATIILFLSYLQIARHGPRQILAVGISFIVGVFLTYFVLGLGLVELVTRLQFLKGVALALNWTLAGFALVIMVLSLRDGVLCLQGRLAETTLQLPGFLKERIRRVARTGARHRNYVVAAFLSGVVISVLELACTGQVYLPTIYYMIQAGRTTAIWYLFLYNLAFILPLVIVFVLAYRGMRSEALIRFQQRHSAAVKFGTAALFLALFLLLAWQIAA